VRFGGLEGRFRLVLSIVPIGRKERRLWIISLFIYLKFKILKMINKVIFYFIFRKITWQLFCHVSEALVVPIWPDLQPVNLRELTALQKGQKTSNG